MKNILFITSQYRVGERIFPILPTLCKKYNVDLLKTYQMDYGHKWVGDSDMRIHFDNKYISLFENVYDRKNAKDINFKKYDKNLSFPNQF